MSRSHSRQTGQPDDQAEAAVDSMDPEVCALRSRVSSLASMDLFRDVTDEEMDEIGRVTVTQTIPKGRILYTPAETGEALFLLRSGAVQIYRMSPEGRKLVIARIHPYAFFGEMSCLGQGMYDTFAEALEDSEVSRMNCADVERLLLSKPRIAFRILEALGRRVLEAERQLEDFAFKGLVPRLASLLLREADGDEVRGLSHQDIAERLGVYRETVTNVLNELKAAGIISIGRKRITITDRRRIERAAGE